MKRGARSLLVALLMAAAASSPAAAQIDLFADDPFLPSPIERATSQIEPLFGDSPVLLPGTKVTGLGGPPWWMVSDADSTVYILASPAAPVDFWDTRLLEQRLKGANRLILQPDIKAGRAVAEAQLMIIAGSMLTGDSTELEGALIPAVSRQDGTAFGRSLTALRTFRDARQKAGLPETRYGGLSLSLAGFALAGDLYDRLPKPDLPGETVEQTAERIAYGLDVPAEPAISYGGSDWTRLVNRISATNDACVSATLKDLEQAPARVGAFGPDQVKTVTQAWAHGDVAPLIAAYRSGTSRAAGMTLRLDANQGVVSLTVRSPVCLRQISLFKTVSDHWLTDETEAVIRALKTPGKTVVVYKATDLIFVGGVLDQLTKRGFTVKAADPRGE